MSKESTKAELRKLVQDEVQAALATSRQAGSLAGPVTDYELERGEHPIGCLVHICTVGHAWRGTLCAVTPSYYVLDADAEVALVDSTGAIGKYLEAGAGGSPEDIHKPAKGTLTPVVRVCRGAGTWLVSWEER